MRRLLPAVPLRHWTLTLPSPLRESIEADDPRVRQLVRAFVDRIFEWYRAVLGVGADASCGAVVVVHRLGTALDRNLHLHVAALDGAFVQSAGRRRFEAVEVGPNPQQLGQIAAGVSRAVGSSGQRSSRLGSGARRVHRSERPAKRSSPTGGQRRSVEGIGVYAGQPVRRGDGPGVIRLTRYLARPELDPEALRVEDDERVAYRMRRHGPDGASHIAIPTKELTQRLASLGTAEVGRFRYYGVLAPAASERWQAVPTQLTLVEGQPKAVRAPGARGWTCPKCDAPMQIVAVEEQITGAPPTTPGRPALASGHRGGCRTTSANAVP